MKVVPIKNYFSLIKENDKVLEELNSQTSIRALLSKFMNVSHNISFRNNVTTVFADILESFRNFDDYFLIYSNLEHPCIINIIEAFFPKERTVCLDVYHLLLNGNIEEIENRLSKNYNVKSIYLFSHILWNTGIILDIEKMSKRIKGYRSENIIIIDGAQSVGNIKNIYSNNFKKEDIDFYLGCTHKWIGSSNILGFVIIGDIFIRKYRDLAEKIFLKDLFSIFAGNSEFKESKFSMSTYDFNLLLSLTKELNSIIRVFCFPNVNNNFKLNNDIYFINHPSKKIKTSRYFSFYGKKENLEKSLELFNEYETSLVEDKNLPFNYYWLRVGK